MTDNAGALVKRWSKSTLRMQFIHFEAASYYETLNHRLGVPTLVLAVIVGTSAFSNASQGIANLPLWAQVLVKIAILIVGVASAVMTAIQTFFKYGDRSEKHRVAAKAFTALRMELEQLTVFLHDETKAEIRAHLAEAAKKYCALVEDAPEAPRSIWRNRGITLEKAIEEALEFADSAIRLGGPHARAKAHSALPEHPADKGEHSHGEAEIKHDP